MLDDLGPELFSRRIDFQFEGVRIDQQEVYFRGLRQHVRDRRPRVDREEERRSITEHRWWTRDELMATSEAVYPEGLADLLLTLEESRAEGE